MKTAIILHGKPSKEEYFNAKRDSQSNSHWLPWIQEQLLLKGVLAQTLEFPEPYEPIYEEWRKVFERCDVNEDTILIGHSCGGGFLVRWLSENKVKVGRVVLVAPWLDPDHELHTDFFNFELDAEVPERVDKMIVFVSNDDDADIQTSVSTLAAKWPNARIIKLESKGHFTFGDMGTREFPELKEVLA
jgi:predicted alpha/beta hydrolase family esterase